MLVVMVGQVGHGFAWVPSSQRRHCQQLCLLEVSSVMYRSSSNSGAYIHGNRYPQARSKGPLCPAHDEWRTPADVRFDRARGQRRHQWGPRRHPPVCCIRRGQLVRLPSVQRPLQHSLLRCQWGRQPWNHRRRAQPRLAADRRTPSGRCPTSRRFPAQSPRGPGGM